MIRARSGAAAPKTSAEFPPTIPWRYFSTGASAALPASVEPFALVPNPAASVDSESAEAPALALAGLFPNMLKMRGAAFEAIPPQLTDDPDDESVPGLEPPPTGGMSNPHGDGEDAKSGMLNPCLVYAHSGPLGMTLT